MLDGLLRAPRHAELIFHDPFSPGTQPDALDPGRLCNRRGGDGGHLFTLQRVDMQSLLLGGFVGAESLRAQSRDHGGATCVFLVAPLARCLGTFQCARSTGVPWSSDARRRSAAIRSSDRP